ncbi:hypothetical protein ACHAXA_002946 [Cyclostephanos tholiformis]|uniref:Uncharacterized protein n=1 Tax=Cyclostephanos tholiformis TaxID=382380 RepID=A0ABD3RXR2_9STRA
MLDMGGVAQAGADTRINVGKNNKVRAVALDFHLITRSIEERRKMAEQESAGGIGNRQLKSLAVSSPESIIQPDTSLVEQLANILNVKLGGLSSKSKRSEDDDFSSILGSLDPSEKSSTDETNSVQKVISSPSRVDHMDIRTKYAAKLRSKIDGGVAGLELVKSDMEGAMKRGDASIHLAARDLISSEGMGGESNTSSTRWLATTGVGKLLSYLSSRSMHIALLPLPSTPSHPQSDEDVKRTYQEMVTLTKQLPNVQFDLLLPDGRRRGEEKTERSNDNTSEDVLKNVLSKIHDIPPLQFVIVSDREDYLKAARDHGMYTCRIRPKSKRRGDFTTNYDVEDVGSVLDVINDINGISFNSALKG